MVQPNQTYAPVPQQQSEPVSFGDWMLTYLLCFIPLVGLIMLFVWAFGGSTNPSKANWAKAALLWGVIIGAIYVIIAIVGVAMVAGARGGFGQ